LTDPHKKDPRQNDPRSLDDAGQMPVAPKKLSSGEVLALGAFSTLFSLIARLFRRTTPAGTVSSRPNASALTEPSVTAQCADCMQKASRGDEDGRVLNEEPLSHEQIGAFLVVLSFLIGAAGGVGFLFLYWTGGSNILLGCTLACSCGGFGAALVFWSHMLTLKREIVEPRESMEPPDAERQRASDDFQMGAAQIHRRGLLKFAIAGGTGIFAAIFVSLFRSLGGSPDQSLYSTIWKRGQMLVSMEGKPMKVGALEPGSTAIVFPEGSVGSERAQTVLIRVDESHLQLPGDRSDWAPNGNLAFSRVCTHAGCPVGIYETTTHLLMCPCHQSTFDVLRGAEPTAGPAARALPQLPLYVDSEGILRAGSGFSDIPGPGFWSMP
jgi:ubiquinol-cytochrome c reductase iron-sulfur subunit